MKPSMKSLEKIVSEFPDYVPDRVVLLGSYAIISRIYLDKNLDVNLYRDTKDLDVLLLPEQEEDFLENATVMPFTGFVGHYKVNLKDTVLELFTYTSYSDLVGEEYNEFLEFLLEKDSDGNYFHLDELKIGERTFYVPKIAPLILMKVRAYGKRDTDETKDRDDLAFLRGYLPTRYNNALNYIKQRQKDYPIFSKIIEKHEEMFNT